MLQKEPDFDPYGKPTYDQEGKQRFKCGFKIGGGIDQDPTKSPQGYPDKVRSYLCFYYDNVFVIRDDIKCSQCYFNLNFLGWGEGVSAHLG